MNYSKRELNVFANEVIPYLVAEATRLGLEQATALLTLMTENLAKWNVSYPLSNDKNNRTHLIIEQTRMLQIVIEGQIRTIQQLLKHGLAELTPEDYAIIRIHVDKSRTAVPIPTDIIELSVVDLQKLIVTVMISIGQLPMVNYRSVFSRINDSAEVFGVLTEATVLTPPEATEYKHLITTKKSNTDLVFTDVDAGKRLWLNAYFLNPKGEKGPLGVPISIIIPG